MQSVCDQIPATLPDDLERVGYHSKCYKHFVRHFHRLGDDTEPGPSTSSWHHSPRKPGGSAEPIFLPECIFCEKVETKDAHRNTERPTTFPSFKNKENAWEQIETRAEKMGLYRLHRKVKNKDLFACEAKHHPSCFKAFRTAFYNYERAIHRAEAPKEQACMSAAHEKAFNSVLEHIQTQVIQQNKVLQLSSLRLLYVEELKLNGYENSNYRSEKLLKRLQNDPIKEHIHFTKVDHDKCDVISFWLVHSSNITVSEKAEIRKGEEAVQRTLTTIKNFTNPFTIIDKDKLYCLASGAPVPMDVEMDVLQAEAVGKAAKADFIRRLESGEPESFFNPIKRKKLKTMEASNKKITLTSSQGKVIQYQEQSNLAFLLLVKSQSQDEPLDLGELMKYCLMPVPPSLGTPDGFFCKTNKASILHYLLEDTTPQDLQYPKDALFIQDGMALLHTLANLPPTCGEICLQVLDQMVAKQHFLFSTDSYHPESIKAQERLRRGSSEKIILAGPATRKPYDFKMFLANDDNKKQMCQLLLKVWSGQEAATRLERTEMAVLIVEGKAHQLASTNGKVEVRELPTIYSNQEETDTRVVLYLHHAATIGYKNAVVRTPDTDILLILLHHAHNIKLTVYLDTGSGKHRQLVNVSELAESLGEDYCATLLGYYVFSGEDCTSAFKGKGKVGPLKKLEKNPRFHRAFGELGDNWDANPEVERQLEKFTCVMYGQSRESSVDIVRAKLLRKMVGEDKTLTSKSKVDLARLPPCQSALKPHIQRVNHRVALYKRADQPIIEKPKPYEEQGWIRTDEGLLKPMWSSGPILPTSLVDLLNTGEHEEEEEEEGEEEFDSDDFDENDDD
uniref:uncharacterized protein n=1 Tax=Myxine glutinosa TaxID=7769 RepID=UPI00358E939A